VIALLDTNILIASAEAGEDAPPLDGFDDLTVSSLSYAELTLGLYTTSNLRELQRRMGRLAGAEATYGPGLPFDDQCVRAYDRILAAISESGGTAKADRFDRMIAATALAHDLVVVTRDLTGFAGLEGLVHVTRR
jgi:predicted nucleic acid-binding protein